MNYIENELEILSKVKSRLFPDLYFAFEDSYYVYFIMEYCPHNLFDLIMNSKHGIGERNKKKYFI